MPPIWSTRGRSYDLAWTGRRWRLAGPRRSGQWQHFADEQVGYFDDRLVSTSVRRSAALQPRASAPNVPDTFTIDTPSMVFRERITQTQGQLLQSGKRAPNLAETGGFREIHHFAVNLADQRASRPQNSGTLNRLPAIPPGPDAEISSFCPG